MLETSMEVFMDDFSVFGDSLDSCLANLEQMLIRCKQAHLVLNWGKCHFMATEGIVLEFNIEIKNKKGAKNVTADHLSRLEHPNLEELRDEDIDDNFPDETLMNVSSNDKDVIPWMIRRRVYGFETRKILDECHHGPTGDTMVLPPHQRKYLMLDSIVQPCSKKPTL
ncbi:hypothetical protein Tco_1084124 [Tanacetum coccineum]